MAGSGKILTVSYGAFSCGLDGFDDPLQTMTAILDYLRYLEAIDGDGGAAPATPDIDILTGIAARGLTRRVEVDMQEGGIVLRALPVQEDGTRTADAQECAAGACPEDGTTPAPRTGQDLAQPDGPAVGGRALGQQHPGEHACATAARVLRVRRADLEQLISHGVLQDDAGPAADRTPHDTADATLSPQGEIELQRELAGIEAERADPATPVATLASGPADSAPVDAKTSAQAHAGDDLSRIFEETDSHLGTSASSRRRNAIQHLRAALAATRAETRTSPEPRRDRDDPPGRTGPRAAARLRRARAASRCGPDVQPADCRLDPLRLMAEQRIDTPQGPGRERAPPPIDVAATPSEDFGAFVARVEGAGLPELIEAAAAYLADIEGFRRFSRPMLMEKLDQIGVADVREDMLCACDALLDTGKLRKCSDGRYATTAKTGFRATPDAGARRDH